MNATRYTITSEEGATVYNAWGKRDAEGYIRTLMNEGVSYSVEISTERADEYTRDAEGNITGEY